MPFVWSVCHSLLLLLTTYRAEEVRVEHHDHRCDAVLLEHARLPVGGEAIRGHVGDDEEDADELSVLDGRVRLLVRVGVLGMGMVGVKMASLLRLAYSD